MQTAVDGVFCKRNSENAWIWVPRSWKSDQSRRGIIGIHGVGQDATVGGGAATIAAESGCVYAWCDLSASPGGLSGWGNSSMLNKIASQWATLKSEFNVKPDKMLIDAISMGTAVALMTILNPDSISALNSAIAGVHLALPVASIDDIYTNNILSQQTVIDTAYGGASTWPGVKAARDPYLNMTAIAAANVPMVFQYSTTDTVARPQFSTVFGSAMPNCTQYAMPNTTGHNITGLSESLRQSFLLQYASK